MIPRVKSVAANLFLAVCCGAWPLFLARASPLFGVFIGMFLWPLGVYYLFQALTLKVEDEFLPRSPSPPARVEAPTTGETRADNYAALLDWVARYHPGWPRSAQHRFAAFLSNHFGTWRWSGDNETPIFSEAIDAYLADRERHPPVFIDLTAISTSESLGHTALKRRMDQAPRTPQTAHFRATLRGEEVGFVVLDLPEHSADVVLYELYVNPNTRGRGMGSEILRTVEDFAWRLQRPRVLLRPRQIDPDSMTNSELATWYAERGYVPAPSEGVLLQKVVG